MFMTQEKFNIIKMAVEQENGSTIQIEQDNNKAAASITLNSKRAVSSNSIERCSSLILRTRKEFM